MSNRRQAVLKLFLAFLVTISSWLPALLQADWPTLHRDYQRSGYTEEIVDGPYQRKWWRDFHDEMIATRCEAIVAEGKVFVGTFAGRMMALDVADGRSLWSCRAAGPIGASPCYHAGRLYFGSDDAFNRGTLYCVDADSGNTIWTHRTPGGIWASPACDGDTVYVGDRSGVFHAVHAADGTTAWTFLTAYMILKPASFSPDGKQVVFGSEDMHVYCLSPDGQLLWKSRKLSGLSLRDQAPTIWQGLAIVRSNPADAFHTVLGRNGETLEAIQRAIPVRAEDRILLDKWGDLLMAPRGERRKAETNGITDYLRSHCYDQSFFAFDVASGDEPWIAPIFYTCGLHNPATPPTFNPKTGELYTLSRSALTHYVRGVRRYSCLVRLDRQTGMPEWFWPERDEGNWAGFPMIPDEAQALGMMGNRIIGTHQGTLSLLDPNTGVVTPISPTRDTYAGIFGPGALPGKFDEARRLAREGYLTGMPNEWHGPDRAIVSVSDGRIFWIAGSQVVCLAGPAVPRSASGGDTPPKPFKSRLPSITPGGNVANSGGDSLGDTSSSQTISAQALTPYLDEPSMAPKRERGELASQLRDQLEAEVLELVRHDDSRRWAPLVVQLGIGRGERHFWRTAQTMQIVSLALPHLSEDVRTDAVTFLDQMFSEGCPLRTPVHPSAGARREPFDFGPGMAEFASAVPRYQANIEDLYAVWAYAFYADRWTAVLNQGERIRAIFDRFAENPPPFDPDDMEHDACQHLNGRIGGLIAAARIFDRSDDSTRRDRALAILAETVALRVHHERLDRRLVRPTKGESRGIHQAKVPRYVDLVPELSRILRQFAGDALERNVTDLRTALPLWYQAYGERMIGGENYISPPHLARGVFLIWADGTESSPEQLASKLDQPWCKADLYFIEKCSASLRAFDK